MINRDYMLSLENKLQGYHTRLKELHFDAPTYTLHKLTDEFDEELLEFDDALMENLQPLPNFGFIHVGEIHPELPEALEFENLLIAVRGLLADSKGRMEETMYSGAINIIDDFFATVNKYIYLTQIAKKGE